MHGGRGMTNRSSTTSTTSTAAATASAPVLGVATTDATTRQTAAIRRLIVNMVTSQRAPDVYHNVRAPFLVHSPKLVTLPSKARLDVAPWSNTMMQINLVVADGEFRYRLAGRCG
jgi:cysteine sulfinate desulfinase/cysteine desulfurase-like protein